jgi:hypothetical protein
MKLTKETLKQMIREELKEARYGGKSGYRRENPNPMGQSSDMLAPKDDHVNPPIPPRDYGYDPEINAVLNQHTSPRGSALSKSAYIIVEIVTKNPNTSFDEIVNMISTEMTNPFSGNITPERVRDRYGQLIIDLITAMNS